jgi:cysteinyl-tRNA synthetase
VGISPRFKLLLTAFIYLCKNKIVQKLHIYNSLSGKKEEFIPLVPGKIGMYVCGPTLYSEPHMGNMRTFINFDFIYRCLLHLGYDVKYVRNITDAGHITNSAGQEVDSIGKVAKAEQLQSLEIVYKYNVKFQTLQQLYNLLPPSIEPTATSHIQEQIEAIEKILSNGYAYVTNGSVYFDVRAYMNDYPYGTLSGRKVDELEAETRTLQSQGEKRFFADFALWKKAHAEDMQIWRSPWGDGNPGWHIECTAMSTKYLGKSFDIHGGGMDLKFPHHEDEIAQNCGAFGCNPARFWLHANMLNVNGQKMSKSLGNFFLPKEIIEGSSPLFDKPYSPSVVRFFMLQSHYRSTLDFTKEAINASEKGFERLMEGMSLMEKIEPSQSSSFLVSDIIKATSDAICDDFNAPILIATLFDVVKHIHLLCDGKEQLTQEDLSLLKSIFTNMVHGVLGIEPVKKEENKRLEGVMEVIVALRQQAREQKNWNMSDMIRDGLEKAGIQIKDNKEGTSWT